MEKQILGHIQTPTKTLLTGYRYNKGMLVPNRGTLMSDIIISSANIRIHTRAFYNLFPQFAYCEERDFLIYFDDIRYIGIEKEGLGYLLYIETKDMARHRFSGPYSLSIKKNMHYVHDLAYLIELYRRVHLEKTNGRNYLINRTHPLPTQIEKLPDNSLVKFYNEIDSF